MTARGSVLVASGIALSRLAGLARERTLAHVLGDGPPADAFRAALRIPNVVQNLLGEGVLSASFIPVYARLLAEGRHADARRVAGAVLALILATAGAATLVGIAAAPWLVDVLAPGFHPDLRDETAALVRLTFPMTGLLAVSAWGLGVLNSHRRFFASYAAPVAWNLAIVSALLAGSATPEDALRRAGWGALAGGLLQGLVMVPTLWRVAPDLRPAWASGDVHVAQVIKQAGPAILGRGVVQISSLVDGVLASLLAPGSLAAIGYAQTLTQLPFALFGASTAAAELPELARQQGDPAALAARTRAAVERVAWLSIGSAVALTTLSEPLVGTFFQTGRFDAGSVERVGRVVAAFAPGLAASAASRPLVSALSALGDTAGPARIATVRVITSLALGLSLMLAVESIPSLGWTAPWPTSVPWGAAMLGVASSVAAFVEATMLGLRLSARAPNSHARLGVLARATAIAAVAAAVALIVPKTGWSALADGIATAATFSLCWLVLARAAGGPRLR